MNQTPNCLTEFEAQCQDLRDAGLSVEESARILEVGPGSVRQALRNAHERQRAPQYAEARQRQRDVEAAAKNYRAEEVPTVEVVAGEVREGPPKHRWRRFPSLDHARQQI